MPKNIKILCVCLLTLALGACWKASSGEQKSNAISVQQQEKPIDFEHFDETYLNKLLLKKINLLRISEQAAALNIDPVLQKAAVDQAQYMSEFGDVTHSQPERAKKNPQQRIKFYGGNHQSTAENLMLTFVDQPVLLSDGTQAIVIKTYEQLAQVFLSEWLNSPNHRRNLINKEYQLTGLAFATEATGKEVYAAQVFSSKN
jgi:uncharacterized protein YkwD